MWHCVYSLLWQIAPPVIRHYLRKRAKLAPAYAEHWNERFGKPITQPVQQAIWIHAVSVGETRAAAPLIAALQRDFPDAPILLTQMTPTGRATAQQLFPFAQCRYLPYDRADYVAQFLQEHRPKFGVLMETELWPNWIHGAAQQGVPLFLANARLSDKSLHGYLKAAGLFRPALAQLRAVFAQTTEDAERLRRLGADPVYVCGNSKYDITPPASAWVLAQQFKQRIGQRPVMVCGSTRVDKQGVDEAALLLQAWQTAQTDALLVLVPRHPERFHAVFELAQQMGFRVQKRSDNSHVRPDTQVWVGDSMGELFAYYAAADVVFVGGSLVDTGCQNVIEPIACGKPTVFGFSTYNFQATCSAAVAMGVAIQVPNAQAWRDTSLRLLQHESERTPMQERAKTFIETHQGASERMAAHIAHELAHAEVELAP